MNTKFSQAANAPIERRMLKLRRDLKYVGWGTLMFAFGAMVSNA